jgi:hypothetical protein
MILEEMISYAPSWDRDLSGLLPLARGLCDLRRSRCDRPRDPPRLGVTKAAPSYGSATLFGIARRSPAVACAAPHGSLPLVDCRLRCSLLLTTPTVALDEHLQPGLKNAAIDWLTTFALRLQDLVARIQDRAGATLADLQQAADALVAAGDQDPALRGVFSTFRQAPHSSMPTSTARGSR